MSNLSAAAVEVFNILKTASATVQMFDERQAETTEPMDARNFFARPQNIMIQIFDKGDNSTLNVSFGASLNLSDVMGLIDTLKTCATKFNLLFSMQKFGKEIKPKDFASDTMIKEGKQSPSIHVLPAICEQLYGTSRSSYLKLPNARMIIRHSGKIDEAHFGSRTRSIQAIFIENKNLERFLMPTTDLTSACAMTNHVHNDGSMSDLIGQQINRMTRDFTALVSCTRQLNKSPSLTESALNIKNECETQMRNIKTSLSKMTTRDGYANIKPNMIQETDSAISESRIKEVYNIFRSNGTKLNRKMVENICRILDKSEISEATAGRKPAVEPPTFGVLGFKVYQHAWADFKAGKLELTGRPDINNEATYTDKTVELAQKLAQLIPVVRDHSLANLFDGVSEEILNGKVEGVRLGQLRTIAKSALKAAKVPYDSKVIEGRKPAVEPPTFGVLGFKVYQHAWADLKAGKLELIGKPDINNEATYINKTVELAQKLSQIIPVVRDHSMANLLDGVSEELLHDKPTGDRLGQLRTIAKSALKAAKVPYDSKVIEGRKPAVEPATFGVLGFKVYQHAWADFKAGKLELTGRPDINNEATYTDKTVELAQKLSQIIPVVRDHSLANLFDGVSEEILSGKVEGVRLSQLRTIAKSALKAANVSLSKDVLSKDSPSEAIQEYVEWLGDFRIDKVLSEMNDSHLDQYSHKQETEMSRYEHNVDTLIEDFDSRAFFTSHAAEDIRRDVHGILNSEEVNIDKSEILGALEGYLKDHFRSYFHDTSLDDSDVTAIAKQLYDAAVVPFKKAGYLVDSEMSEEATLSREDVLLPSKNAGKSLKREVEPATVRDPADGHEEIADRNYATRLRTLAGMKSVVRESSPVPPAIPEDFAHPSLANAYRLGWSCGHGVACHHVPTLGSTTDDGKVIVDAGNIYGVHEQMCQAAVDEYLSYNDSPFDVSNEELKKVSMVGFKICHDNELSAETYPTCREAEAAAVADGFSGFDVVAVAPHDDMWGAHSAGCSDSMCADLAGYDKDSYDIKEDMSDEGEDDSGGEDMDESADEAIRYDRRAKEAKREMGDVTSAMPPEYYERKAAEYRKRGKKMSRGEDMIDESATPYFNETVRKFADSHKSSREIAYVILDQYGDESERVWADPTDDEAKEILAAAWEITDADTDTLHWGDETCYRAEDMNEAVIDRLFTLAGIKSKQAAPAPDNNTAAEPATSQPLSTPVQPTREQEQDADHMMAYIARNLYGAGAIDKRFAAGEIRELSRLSYILKGSSLADRINSFMHREASEGLVLGNYTFQ